MPQELNFKSYDDHDSEETLNSSYNKYSEN